MRIVVWFDRCVSEFDHVFDDADIAVSYDYEHGGIRGVSIQGDTLRISLLDGFTAWRSPWASFKVVVGTLSDLRSSEAVSGEKHELGRQV